MHIELQRKLSAATPGFMYILPDTGDPPIETVMRAREYVQSRLLPGETMYHLDCTLGRPPGHEGSWPVYWLIPNSWLDNIPEVLDSLRCCEVVALY